MLKACMASLPENPAGASRAGTASKGPWHGYTRTREPFINKDNQGAVMPALPCGSGLFSF